MYRGLMRALADRYRVIALDNRGHGASEGPHDPALYGAGTHMAEDVVRLMDHLGVGRADVMGYSMGAWITGHLAVRHPERLRSAIFGGLGMTHEMPLERWYRELRIRRVGEGPSEVQRMVIARDLLSRRG